MARRTTHWPKVKPGDYARWRKDFDRPWTDAVLAKLLAKLRDEAELAELPPEEAENKEKELNQIVEHIRIILFAAQLGPRQMTSEQVRNQWFRKEEKTGEKIPLLDTRIDVIDYAILMLAALMKDKKKLNGKNQSQSDSRPRFRDINKDIASLLNCADIPTESRAEQQWSPEAVKKRRDRVLRYEQKREQVAWRKLVQDRGGEGKVTEQDKKQFRAKYGIRHAPLVSIFGPRFVLSRLQRAMFNSTFGPPFIKPMKEKLEKLKHAQPANPPQVPESKEPH
jgi:hypothetical protein